MPRIALIHALLHSVAPANAGFDREWREAERINLLDDSLSSDLARTGRGLDAAMHDRFHRLADYAVAVGAEGILFTCSAFGPCIESVARRHAAIPVLKPNEAMIAELAQRRGKVALLATFAPTLASIVPEIPSSVSLELAHVDGALEAMNAGDVERHDELIAGVAKRLAAHGCAHVALAQMSMARARGRCAAESGLPVFTTVDSAARQLRARFESPPPDRRVGNRAQAQESVAESVSRSHRQADGVPPPVRPGRRPD